MKKYLAALAAAAMAATLMSVAAFAEGIDGDDDEILDDEDLEVIVLDDEDEEVVVVVDEDEATVVVTTVATSPATGNSPVALAVIPVALAAAAVVAKKRG